VKSGNHCETDPVSAVSSETRVDPVADMKTLTLLNLPIHVSAPPVTFEPLFHLSAKVAHFEDGVAQLRQKRCPVGVIAVSLRRHASINPDPSLLYVSHSGQGMGILSVLSPLTTSSALFFHHQSG
jgi:hypothetical protein